MAKEMLDSICSQVCHKNCYIRKTDRTTDKCYGNMDDEYLKRALYLVLTYVGDGPPFPLTEESQRIIILFLLLFGWEKISTEVPKDVLLLVKNSFTIKPEWLPPFLDKPEWFPPFLTDKKLWKGRFDNDKVTSLLGAFPMDKVDRKGEDGFTLKNFINFIKVRQEFEGRVSNTTDHGVFVDIGVSKHGRLWKTENTHQFEKSDRIKVRIKSINRETKTFILELINML